LTLFLPVDDAFASLHELERLYLESEFATADLTRIVNAHAVVEETVKWSETFDPNAKCKDRCIFYVYSPHFVFSKDHRWQCP
jgi:solute carrier family 25 carnitine/acylcarnitine transporter 20/29